MSTRKAYNSAQKRYLTFCQRFNLPPTPTSETILCRFAAFLADQKLRASSIKCYLSGVRQLHLVGGLGDPNISKMAKLEQVLKGIKRQQAEEVGPRTQRLPITPELLMAIKGAWEKNLDLNKRMLWAAALLCFFGFLRSGEVCIPHDQAYDKGVHLSFSDIVIITPDNPQSLQIRIKASKTDPFRQGVNVYVGRTHKALCPVSAMLAYLILAYLIRRGSGPGPLFRFQDGKPLTRSRFVERIRQALTEVGIDPTPYSGHSFRSGAATTAARQGIGDATIKMLGRWKSSAYQLYIKTPRQHLAKISGTLVKDQDK